MVHGDFSYERGAQNAASLSVDLFYAERIASEELRHDLEKSGYQLNRAEPLESMLEHRHASTSEVILLDCVGISPRHLAVLAQLDMDVARAGKRLVIVTSLDDLDAVFACFDSADPQFLVNPSRTDILLALGRAASIGQAKRLREMSEEERLRLLKLADQVEAIARRLEESERAAASGLSGLRDVKIAWKADIPTSRKPALEISNSPALPDPSYVRQIIHQRQARLRFFDGELFSDPAWDMLLDLTAARGEGKPVSVTSLCIASGVPATTALRWIKQLIDCGLFERTEDVSDKRRAFIALSDKAANAMAGYFHEFRQQALAA